MFEAITVNEPDNVKRLFGNNAGAPAKVCGIEIDLKKLAPIVIAVGDDFRHRLALVSAASSFFIDPVITCPVWVSRPSGGISSDVADGGSRVPASLSCKAADLISVVRVVRRPMATVSVRGFLSVS
ncbi:hypothetical protein TWF281_005508 [Arthrobotrys megalospora]